MQPMLFDDIPEALFVAAEELDNLNPESPHLILWSVDPHESDQAFLTLVIRYNPGRYTEPVSQERINRMWEGLLADIRYELALLGFQELGERKQ